MKMRSKIFIVTSLMLLPFSVRAEGFPIFKAKGVGRVVVTRGSDTLRGFGAAMSSLLQSSIRVEMEINRQGQMSVVQEIRLGAFVRRHRFDLLWKFLNRVGGRNRFQLINAEDGRTVGHGFCQPTVCQYNLELSDQSLRISEHLEKTQNSSQSYELIGTLTDTSSWIGRLELYYRAQLTQVNKPAE